MDCDFSLNWTPKRFWRISTSQTIPFIPPTDDSSIAGYREDNNSFITHTIAEDIFHLSRNSHSNLQRKRQRLPSFIIGKGCHQLRGERDAPFYFLLQGRLQEQKIASILQSIAAAQTLHKTSRRWKKAPVKTILKGLQVIGRAVIVVELGCIHWNPIFPLLCSFLLNGFVGIELMPAASINVWRDAMLLKRLQFL